MRTPKSLYVQQRRIYHPELMSCPSCGIFITFGDGLLWVRHSSLNSTYHHAISIPQ